MDVGPYRLEELLGRGAMGEVYRAYDTRRRRTVALKLLATHLGHDESFRERFRREAHATAQLQDPHVIPLHDFGEFDGRLFLDMRLVEGTDLGALLERDGTPPATRAVEIVAQVAEALDDAHRAGLVHRDVKPSNIMVSRTGFVYLVDFGIARSVGDSQAPLTSSGGAIGTLAYMAPERFGDGPSDHRVDVYSLACVLYELLTGRRPFPQSDQASLLRAHLLTPPPRPGAVPGVSAALDEVVARGMAKDPDARPSSAGAFAAAARQALVAPRQSQTPTEVPRPPAGPRPAPTWVPSGGPAPSRGSGTPSPFPGPRYAPLAARRRSPRPVVLGAVALLAVVVLAVVLVAGLGTGGVDVPTPVAGEVPDAMVGRWEGTAAVTGQRVVTVAAGDRGDRIATVDLPEAGCRFSGTLEDAATSSVRIAMRTEVNSGRCADTGSAVLTLQSGGTLLYDFTFPCPSYCGEPNTVVTLSRR